MAKWNEALRIEEALGAKARFAGLNGMPARRKAAQPLHEDLPRAGLPRSDPSEVPREAQAVQEA